MLVSHTTRPARTDDATCLAAIVKEGFEGYRAFAPKAWEPPETAAEAEGIRVGLARPDAWCVIAEIAGEPVGHAAFLPAAVARNPLNDARLAHLWQLFVRRERWGTGVASTLHELVVNAAANRGFVAMRLFTPAEHARARRFYERRGWRMLGEPFHDPGFGMAVVEYRRSLLVAELGSLAVSLDPPRPAAGRPRTA